MRSGRCRSPAAPTHATPPRVRCTRTGWTPDPRHILFAGNGRQAIAGAVSALLSPGDRLGVEAFTYPVVLGILSRLGVTPVPLPVDGEGLVPEALAEANVRAVYLQPTLHNPLGTTMSLAPAAAESPRCWKAAGCMRSRTRFTPSCMTNCHRWRRSLREWTCWWTACPSGWRPA